MTDLTNLPSAKTRWLMALCHLAIARRAAPIMKSASRQAERDLATGDYVRAVDALIAELGAMADCGQLAGIRHHLGDLDDQSADLRSGVL